MKKGLTRREHFAAMALQGLLANPRTAEQIRGTFGQITPDESYEAVCITARCLADQLIEQLNDNR